MRKTDSAFTGDGKLKIAEELCDFCGACVAVCPLDCIILRENDIAIDFSQCDLCKNCLAACPHHIIEEVV